MIVCLRSSQCLVFYYSLTEILVFLSVIDLRHVTSTKTIDGAKDYHSEFGDLSHIGHKTGLSKAIKRFQIVSDLSASGELNDETLRRISPPRCGVVDHADVNSGRRSKRYVLWSNAWHVRDLTYHIYSFPEGLNSSDVRNEIARAFRVWSEYTNLIFTPTETDPVDIEIRFENGYHGPGFEYHENFDGPSGILARAFCPCKGGDVYFDRSENWVINNTNLSNKPVPIDLFQIAVHEFGHSLGLSHSDVPTSVMAPKYLGYNTNFRLDPDDVAAIQELYGSRIELCHDPKIDAAFNSDDGKMFLFKENKYYVLDENGLSQAYLISDGWPGVPDNIDAASKFGSDVYFFKGSKVVIFPIHPIPPFSIEISQLFRNVPNNVDAVTILPSSPFVWKGENLWSFYNISSFKSNFSVDAALEDPNGAIILFHGDKVYNTQTTNWEKLRDWLGC